MTNVADVLHVGEKCFNDGLYEASRLLFSSVSNYARLATTLVYLNDFPGAIEAARKAGNTLCGSKCTLHALTRASLSSRALQV